MDYLLYLNMNVKKLDIKLKTIKKHLKLKCEFNIISYNTGHYWIYYRTKLVVILDDKGKSVYGGNVLSKGIKNTLLFYKILKKQSVCKLKIKHAI